MTPKEKAEELYEAFFYTIPSFTDEGQLEHKTTKQCALIAVDEILNLVCCMDGKEHWQEYYEKVKIEIENL